MRSSELLSKQWCDLVFENRNREYGAYRLRAQAGQRYRRALGVVGGTLLLSESMVMRGSDIFLDDTTVPQLEKKLNVKIKLTPQDGAKLFDNIVGI